VEPAIDYHGLGRGLVATESSRGPAAPQAGSSWSANVFGLVLEGRFEVPGLPDESSVPAGPRTALELASREELEAEWPSSGSVLMREWDDAKAEVHEQAGYRLSTEVYGNYQVSADGLRVRCAPSALPDWQWQQCLIGHVLASAAVVRGLEVIHASAVSVGGRTLAFAASSGTGKTTVALNMVLRGARLMTDDVLAVSTGDGYVMAHPGAGIVNLRHSEADLLTRAGSGLGPVIGDDGEAFRTLVDRDGRSRRLTALYFLERDDSAKAAAIEPIVPPEPRLLLGSVFNTAARTPERLARLLDYCGEIASDVPLFRTRMPPGTSAAELAELVEGQLEDLPRDS
jgi:hypothetical protein